MVVEPTSGSTRYGPSGRPHFARVTPKSLLFGGRSISLAGSNRPMKPSVVLIAKRPVLRKAVLGSPCSTSLTIVIGILMLAKKFATTRRTFGEVILR